MKYVTSALKPFCLYAAVFRMILNSFEPSGPTLLYLAFTGLGLGD